MKWYEWNSLEDFNTWHSELCTQLGFPIVPVNQSTGEPDLHAQPTTKYTDAYQVNDKWIAQVEDKYSADLIETALRTSKLVF